MQMLISFLSKERILLLFISSLWIFHFLGFNGHYGYDDMEYAQIANGILQGDFPINNHFAYRFTLIFPTVLMYSLFGLSDFTSLFSVLLASSGVLYFIYLFCKDFSKTSLFLALGITLSFEYYLIYSDKIMPDIHVCLAFVASIYFIYRKYFTSTNSSINGIGLSASLFYGFLSKGTILLILPLLLFFLIKDLLEKRDLKFWIKSALWGIAFLVIYFFSIYLFSGSFSQRFDAIVANSYYSRCSYDTQSLKILIYRISFDFLNLLKFGELIIPSTIILGFALGQLKKGLLKTKTPIHFFSVVFILLLLSSNFMSISYKSYHPMCLDVRHFLYLFPFAGIALAFILSSDLKNKIILTKAIVIGLAYLYFTQTDDFFTYRLIIGLVLIAILFSNKKNGKKIAIGVLLLILISNPIQLIEGAQRVDYKKQKQLVRTALIENPVAKYVITDPVAARLGNYWNEFDSSKAIFVAYDDFSKESFKEERKMFLLQNYASRFLSYYEDSNYPYPVKEALEGNALLADSSIGLSIYEIKEWSSPLEDGKLILKSSNTFEETPDPWTGKKEANQEAIVFEGKYSNWVHEYSPTLKIALDTIDFKNSKKLFATINLMAYAEEKLEGSLVFTIKSNGENTFYESRKIHPFIKSYSKWWVVSANFTIATDSIPPNSELLIYVWNSDKKKLLIDNFEIEIIGL